MSSLVLFEEITNGECPPIEEEECADEDAVPQPATWTTRNPPDWWSSNHWKGPRVTNGDGKRPCVGNEAAPGDPTDTT